MVYKVDLNEVQMEKIGYKYIQTKPAKSRIGCGWAREEDERAREVNGMRASPFRASGFHYFLQNGEVRFGLAS